LDFILLHEIKMPTELEELVGFIANPNPQIRQLAIVNLVPYSTAEPAVFKSNDLQPIKNLKVLVRDHVSISEFAITILVNLSGDRQVLELLATDEKFMEHIFSRLVVSLPAAPFVYMHSDNGPRTLRSRTPTS
jgi:hypothetical protein